MSRPWLERFLLVVTIALLAAFPQGDARAQRIPSDYDLEMLVKATLATLNDANLTGNYSVLHARSSRQVREQLTPQTFSDAFKAFRDQQIDIAPVLTLRPTFREKPAIGEESRLVLKGHFDTSAQRGRFVAVRYDRVAFDIDFIQSEGTWKMIKVNVDVK